MLFISMVLFGLLLDVVLLVDMLLYVDGCHIIGWYDMLLISMLMFGCLLDVLCCWLVCCWLICCCMLMDAILYVDTMLVRLLISMVLFGMLLDVIFFVGMLIVDMLLYVDGGHILGKYDVDKAVD